MIVRELIIIDAKMDRDVQPREPHTQRVKSEKLDIVEHCSLYNPTQIVLGVFI